MLDRVLVPMDDSELSEEALKFALEAHPDAEITVFHVVGEPSPMMGESIGLALEEDFERAGEKLAEQVLDRARAVATEYDVEIRTEIGYGRPSRAIIKQARDFDAVIIGSHGGSMLDRLFVGNVAQTVFRRCPTPVTVVR